MFLGIDVGTSAVKASVIGADLQPLASASAALTISHPRPSWSEQAPQDWWAATVAAVREATARVEGGGARVAAIGLSGQMHGAVLLDAAGGVIRPAILWNDGRSDAQCAEIAAGGGDLARIAGARPMAGFTAPKIMWLKESEPDAYARIARILLPKDYLGLRLHGDCVTDPSDAAGTFWFDERARDWSAALCAATATRREWLPRVVEGSEAAGALTAGAAAELGLPAGIPVAAGGGDAAAGAIAVGAVRDGAGFLSLGTSGQLFVATTEFRAAPERGVHSYAHCLPGLWFQMATMLNGARPMSWFAEATGAPIATLLDEAEAAAGRPTPLFLPYLTGERTPHGDNLIRGAFYGLGNDTGRGDLMRGIVEAIAYSFADARDAVASVTAMPPALLAIGGGSRSRLLLQTIADVMAVEIRRGEAGDVGPSVGAARLGAVAAGAARAEDLAQAPGTVETFAPDPAAAPRHRERLESYRALYGALKPMRGAPG